MFDCEDLPELDGEPGDPQPTDDTDGAATWADPRLSSEFLRCVPRNGEAGTVLLVGVVHDHPASLFRVATLIDRLGPETVALELPPLAMDLFRTYAADPHVPPHKGGEMSAALQSAGEARTVGIDAPNRAHLAELAGALRRDRPDLDVFRHLVQDLLRGSAHALACRIGATVADLTPLTPRLYTPLVHDVSVFDDPVDQAADETAHVAKSRAFLGVVSLPTWTRLIDETRERTMAAKIEALRRPETDVVVVIGMEHLDPVHGLLGRDDG